MSRTPRQLDIEPHYSLIIFLNPKSEVQILMPIITIYNYNNMHTFFLVVFLLVLRTLRQCV